MTRNPRSTLAAIWLPRMAQALDAFKLGALGTTEAASMALAALYLPRTDWPVEMVRLLGFVPDRAPGTHDPEAGELLFVAAQSAGFDEFIALLDLVRAIDAACPPPDLDAPWARPSTSRVH